MLPSLVIAEHDNASVKDATAKTVTAALALGEPVHVLVAGHNCDGAADGASRLKGVQTVVVADAPVYDHILAEPVAALILSLADRYDAFLAPATANGKNTMPRVAAKLDVPQISEVLRVLAPDTFERPIYAGSAIQTVQAPPGKKVMTVRTTAFKAAEKGGTALTVTLSPGPDPAVSKFAGEELSRFFGHALR